MKQILNVNQSILNILGKAKESNCGYRFMHYAVAEQVEDGVLLFHTLTREMLLLTQEEYDHALELPYLRQHWFVVPENFDDKKQVDIVRWLQKTMNKEAETIDSYTIYTTSDCNARCFYCFELGRPRIPMSDEIALKTAQYIKSHRGTKPVNLRWFGGEPLYNDRAIDIICEYLRKENIPYTSRMISNGYLFDDAMVAKAKDLWKLYRVQISLDGPEEVYNRCKAFIYREGSAYKIVNDNIQRLLDNKIIVVVRLNMDFHNIEDLNTLSDELADRFGKCPGFFVYVRLIIDEKTAWDTRYTTEQWTQLYQAKADLEEKLTKLGVYSSRSPRLSKYLGHIHCMVENSNCIVVAPDGNLGVCEHYSEEGLIGNLDSDTLDQTVINTWRQRCDDVPECKTCFYYPQCIRLKKCPYQCPCIELEREAFRRKTGLAMVNEYRLWLENTADDGSADEEDMI
ncbi:MAG: radical SAM protein [Oscillospiraceae bacterium]|nr:radical SAM protein [Oscillospiraceae bacterium]